MITLKNDREIGLMREAGSIISKTFKYLEDYITPGISTKKLDELADKYIRSLGGIPTCLNYQGYPASICTSINESIVHEIPSNRKLKNGDIITIDMVVSYKGYNADAAWTYPVGDISDENEYLLTHTKNALHAGIEMVKENNRINDISKVIEDYAIKHNLGIVEEFCGHGIGSNMHEEPDVPNYEVEEVTPRLKVGMTICIEPMLTYGDASLYTESDGWTTKTKDKSNAAHFEHTVLVTKDGYEILTPRWDQ